MKFPVDERYEFDYKDNRYLILCMADGVEKGSEKRSFDIVHSIRFH